MTYEDH